MIWANLDINARLRLAYMVHSDTHTKIAGVLRDMEQRVQNLYRKEMQDYVRWENSRPGKDFTNLQQEYEKNSSLQKIESIKANFKEAGLDLKRN